jgi:hypothetical protein
VPRTKLLLAAVVLAAAAITAAVVPLACGTATSGGDGRTLGEQNTSGDGPVTVVAAGDIAACKKTNDEQTAELIDAIDPDAVLTLGDNAYQSGTVQEYEECYGPSWGRYKEKTYPSPGNHEYTRGEANGYFTYFADRVPAAYYSFDIGGWHFVSLNSEIDHDAGSAQARWLRDDLEADDRRCEILYGHRPRWSGGMHGSDETMQAFWDVAVEHDVELVLTGHDHNYQRFHPMDADGDRDDRDGVVAIVAGMGGKSHYELGQIDNRVSANNDAYGVLRLTLYDDRYEGEFIPVEGETFTDSFSGMCR